MSEVQQVLSAEDLQRAFSLFNEASGRLASAYRELEQQVERLNGELEVANGALRHEYREKSALSQRLSSLLDALPGGVVVLDEFGVVIELNPTARRLLGTSVTGVPWHDVEAMHLKPTAANGEWRVVSKHGVERRVSIVAGARGDDNGRILLLTDITEAHDLQQQLERHKRLSSMGEMAAGLAHQLRTPLATALLYAGNLAREQLGEAERLRFAGKALERLRALERMIQDMLLFLRGTPVAEQTLRVSDVVEDAFQILEPRMHECGIVLDVDLGATPLSLRGNEKALIGVLVNLLENALQACEPGDRIGLHARQERADIVIEVADSGRGMGAEVLERLFEPFFTTRTEGTGLGLAIVRSVVEAHGGTVDVESQRGIGSRFILRFPETRGDKGS